MPPPKRPLVPVSSRRKAADDYFPFNFLPVECQLHVLSFLNEVDKCSCALVCLSWSCLIRSWKLWRVADYSRRGVFHLGQEGLLVSNREFERWKSWVHHYTHHLISRRASLLTLKASFDVGDRCNKWSELLSHLLDNVHCRDLSHLDLNWTFTLLEPLDLKVHSSSSSHQDSITKMDQVTVFYWLHLKLKLHQIVHVSGGFALQQSEPRFTSCLYPRFYQTWCVVQERLDFLLRITSLFICCAQRRKPDTRGSKEGESAVSQLVRITVKHNRKCALTVQMSSWECLEYDNIFS